LFFLTIARAQELRSHLGEFLSGDPLISAVAAIDFAAAWLASGGSVRERRANSKAACKHQAAVAEAAEELLRLLSVELPGGCRARPLVATAGIEWDMLVATLERVAVSARQEAAAYSTSGRGRPPDELRDILVSVIHSVYPSSAARKARGSHFERTVELVLRWCGRSIADVHGLCNEALARRPEPPYRVHRTRQATRRR
jgi:hypothetical protein